MDPLIAVSVVATLIAFAGSSTVLVLRLRLSTRMQRWNERRAALDDAFSDALARAGEPEDIEVRPLADDTVQDAEVARLLSDLEDRIKAVEGRFPEASTIEKIASVNDAVMATKIEFLEAEVMRLRGASLTRWDVSLVVFAILGAMSVVLGLVAGALKLL